MKGRLKALFDGDMSLAAYHLALDAHLEIGNNALLARELGVEVEEPFAEIGVGGRLAQPQSPDLFVALVRERLGPRAARFSHGPADSSAWRSSPAARIECAPPLQPPATSFSLQASPKSRR